MQMEMQHAMMAAHAALMARAVAVAVAMALATHCSVDSSPSCLHLRRPRLCERSGLRVRAEVRTAHSELRLRFFR